MSQKFVRCPVCNIPIKENNLPKHLRKVHHKVIGATEKFTVSLQPGNIKRAKKPQRISDTRPVFSSGVEYEDGILWLPSSGSMPNSNPESRDPRDYNLGIPRCPHGVLKTAPCAICNPEEFRKLTGID